MIQVIDILKKLFGLLIKHFVLVFTEDVILAQAAVFVAAGFETSSSTIAFALYEISKNVRIFYDFQCDMSLLNT